MTETAARPLTPEQVHRYSRHIVMPQIGSVGQRKLLDARVLLVGAGGLGSPISIYLTLAGVGTIGIVEDDEVDLSNLQRQILHHDRSVGKPKIESARETLLAYNPHVNVETYPERLTSENALGIVAKYDIVVSGADNFPTRYLLNDAAYLCGKPLVDGGILSFDGQATTFIPGRGCYRCLYPTPPPPDEVPSCADVGVVGALPGLVGTIQALETIKLIVGIGQTLSGRLLLISALDMEFRTVNLRRNPACPLCGDHPTVTRLVDYEAFCRLA
ncbi:MAG: molybdopterin-synthase adenylyltransferase MoeB [Gemmatimonadetes bacterium]|nr:molybdopterin-synthase adenylyltransferase MoeB [Gemmatimonadota bacterium]